MVLFLQPERGTVQRKQLWRDFLVCSRTIMRLLTVLKSHRNGGIEIIFGEARLEDAHPNTAVIRLEGVGEKSIEVQVSSIGGSSINIDKIDGINTNFSGEHPTLIVHNLDQPGHVSEVTSMLAHKSVNIATMQLYRSAKGQMAVMVVECDQPIPEDGIAWLSHVEGVMKVTYFEGV